MNDNDNNILIASQNGCDLVLGTEGAVLHYKDAEGADQELNIADITDGSSLFLDNANINVDWETDMPNLTKSTTMFSGSSVKSFAAGCPLNTTAASMFKNCQELEHVKADVPLGKTVTKPVMSTTVIMSNMFVGCSSLKSVNLKKLDTTPALSGTIVLYAENMFADCTKLESAEIDYWQKTYLTTGNFTDMFKNCKSLKNINLHFRATGDGNPPVFTGMFSGCVLGPEQLQQILDWGWYPKSTRDITIGVDSTKVTQSDIDNNWNSKFLAKNWNVTWELNTAL